MQSQNRTLSFLQTQAHTTKSAKFQPIEPALIERTLNAHGFDLVHLKTGKARKADNAGHQTTVARYRSRTALDIGQGLYVDLIFKVPHLYGALEGVLGLFRGACANQLNVGHRFETIRVKHLGTPIEQLNELIPKLVAQQKRIEQFVSNARGVNLTYDQALSFARRATQLRTGNVTMLDFRPAQLLKARRDADRGLDLFTIFNVVQEGLVRYGAVYQTTRDYKYTVNGVDQVQTKIVNTKTRPIKAGTLLELEFNGALWSLAEDMLQQTASAA